MEKHSGLSSSSPHPEHGEVPTSETPAMEGLAQEFDAIINAAAETCEPEEMERRAQKADQFISAVKHCAEIAALAKDRDEWKMTAEESIRKLHIEQRKARMRQQPVQQVICSLENGSAVFQWPSCISKEDAEDLIATLELVTRQIVRCVNAQPTS